MKRRGAIVASAWMIAVALSVRGDSQVFQPGSPLGGITPVEFSTFRLGLDDFVEVETPEEGLGPAFNGTSCAACHNLPAIGGGGVITELRASYVDERGLPIGLNPAGDTLIHMLSTP